MNTQQNYAGRASYATSQSKSLTDRLLSAKIRKSISVRFALRPPKKGRGYSNPHPLQVWISVNGKRTHFSGVWQGQKLEIDPSEWRVNDQRSSRRSSPINTQILQLRDFIEDIHYEQHQSGGIPDTNSVVFCLRTGNSPEWNPTGGWTYPEDKERRIQLGRYANCLSANSPIDESYTAYIAHLQQSGKELSHITLGRWKRGLLLLQEFARFSQQPLPRTSEITVGWAKRFHAWMQTQIGGSNFKQPVSEGQASRFIHKLSNVLNWMIEEEWINSNPIAKVRWPKHEDKDVLFLEPEHLQHLLNLDWQGTKGTALWWFCLMCCTGMDYPDAVTYARNRKGFEVMGNEGIKIVGKRMKPPHNEYHLPMLDEVNALFGKFPAGPSDISPQCVNRHTALIEDELGIKWRITAKTARKTFGCLMLAAGHRIADVSLMLGHSTITTTERHYVKVRGASIDRSMRRIKVSVAELSNKRE